MIQLAPLVLAIALQLTPPDLAGQISPPSIVTYDLPDQVKPPKPEPPPATSPRFQIYNRALPWNLPDSSLMPSTSLGITITPVTIEATHTDDYTDNVTALTTRFTQATAPLTTLSTMIDEIVGAGGSLDASGSGDLDSGLSPNGSAMSLYDFADQFGGAMATGFLWVRSVTQFNFGASTTAFSFVFAALAWRLIVLLIKSGVQVIDALMRVAEWLIQVAYQLVDTLTGPLT